MFVAIECIYTGEEIYIRRVSPTEDLFPDDVAEEWCKRMGFSIVNDDGYIPNGCGDYRCEIRGTKKANGSCWAAYDFFVECEEY